MHDLVIFDCDGVLVDSEVISNEVLARMRAIGYTGDSDERALSETGAEPLGSLDGLPPLLGLITGPVAASPEKCARTSGKGTGE